MYVVVYVYGGHYKGKKWLTNLFLFQKIFRFVHADENGWFFNYTITYLRMAVDMHLYR